MGSALLQNGFVLRGSEKGYNVEADTLITTTADGRDLNELWNEFSRVVTMHNAKRQKLIDLLTFPVTNVIEDVPQVSGDEFEEASEFGVPKSVRGFLGYFSMGYDFKWYDMAVRYTWKYLAEASAQQVESNHQVALEADNRLIFRKVMNALFRNTNRSADIRGQNYTVYSLYNGDGTVPPAYGNRTFTGSETHYLVSGGDDVDPKDLEDLQDKLTQKGYSRTNGTDLAILVNPAEAKIIRTFRAGKVTNGAEALYDFIPAQGQPAMIVPNEQGLLGSQPASTWRGLNVIGSYGEMNIIEEDYIPEKYLLLLGSGGEGALNNPVGLREHANAGLRGLRLIAGDRAGYPLINSYYSRGFGTGIRQRGGAAIMQIKASGSYDIPAAYTS